jgi:hypothetical protein
MRQERFRDLSRASLTCGDADYSFTKENRLRDGNAEFLSDL